MMFMCNKQHLSNIRNWIYEKIKTTLRLSWKKRHKKCVYFFNIEKLNV